MKNSNINTYAIILAGGSGTRLESDRPKQFILLNEIPVIIRAARQFARIDEIIKLIMVVPKSYITYMQELVHDYNLQKVEAIIAGGLTRQGSSYNALCSQNFNDDDVILFHDAARPFVTTKIIKKTLNAAKKDGASGVYVKAIDTIAKIEQQRVAAIPNRETLFYAQTPQAFKYSIIKDAHEQARLQNIDNATDDISLVYNAGGQVTAIEGDYNNIKITNEFDLRLAESRSADLTES